MRIHIVLQGKGGVGKTLIASLITQYFLSKDKKIECYDTDPINATFNGYSSLNVKTIQLTENNEIIQRNFDSLIQLIADSKSDEIIIDSGAATFLPLLDYLLDNNIPSLLQELGDYELCCHSIVTGSQGLLDSLNGLNELISNFISTNNKLSNVKFYVWLNPFFGPIVADGKNFYDMKIYNRNIENIEQVFELLSFEKSTYGQDYREILTNKITFKEAYSDSTKSIIVRQRLKNIEKKLYAIIENGGL